MSHNSITDKHPPPTCNSNLITSANTSVTVTHMGYSANLLILINASEHCTSLDRIDDKKGIHENGFMKMKITFAPLCP